MRSMGWIWYGTVKFLFGIVAPIAGGLVFGLWVLGYAVRGWFPHPITPEDGYEYVVEDWYDDEVPDGVMTWHQYRHELAKVKKDLKERRAADEDAAAEAESESNAAVEPAIE